MSHPKAHKTKWTLLYLASGYCVRFYTEEAARELALEVGYITPVRIIPPIYA